jgi:hypothetical protein
MDSTRRDRGPMMNDSTQDAQGRGGAGPEAAATATAGQAGEQAQQQVPADAVDWSDAAGDPGSGVPGGGRHKYASGKRYCGTEN